MKEFHTYRLPNGIRGIHRQVRGNVAHCALVVGAGTRDELKSEHGLAHFAEHAFFKGTERRRAYQVNCRLENLGGELNAYTTKEETTLHATVLRGDFAKAAELIADVAFRSTFPERELEREREVILDEINTYKDSPADRIYDDFEDMLFEGSALGHNILGTKAALARYRSEHIHAFVRRTHTTDQMVFSSIGNITPQRIEAIAARHFADMPATVRAFERTAPAPVAPFERSVARHTHQSHCIVGARAYGILDPKRLPLALLVNILGGAERQLDAQRHRARETRPVVQHRRLLHALRRRRHRRYLLQLRPRQPRPLSGAGRRADRPPAHRTALGPTAGAGQETVHRPTGDLGGEQRGLHARRPARAIWCTAKWTRWRRSTARSPGLRAEELQAVADEVFAAPSTLVYK